MVILAYNVPGVQSIALSRKTIADIFLGKIRLWNDTAIASDNPNIALPSQPIRLIVRKDGSGSTEVFTRALSSFSDQWRLQRGIFADPELFAPEGPSQHWPEHVEFFVDGSHRLTHVVEGIPYSLSYRSPNADDSDATVVQLVDQSGDRAHFEEITDRIRKAMDRGNGNAVFVDAAVSRRRRRRGRRRRRPSYAHFQVNDSYPLATYAYFIVNMSTHADVSCDHAKIMVRMLLWHFSENPLVERTISRFHFVPLTPNMKTRVLEEFVNQISCDGRNVAEWIKEEDYERNRQPVAVYVVFAVLLVGVLSACLAIWVKTRMHKMTSWVLEDIVHSGEPCDVTPSPFNGGMTADGEGYLLFQGSYLPDLECVGYRSMVHKNFNLYRFVIKYLGFMQTLIYLYTDGTLWGEMLSDSKP